MRARATAVLVRPEQNRLIPITIHDQELIDRLGFGSEWLARLVPAKPRSLRQNRFYWGLLGKVVDNHDFYRRAEQLHLWLKLRLGYVEEVTFHDGRVFTQVASTSFNTMPPNEFKQFLDGVIDVVCVEVLPGLSRAAIIREVEEMLHLSYTTVTTEGTLNG